jgi:hypothetical protein
VTGVRLLPQSFSRFAPIFRNDEILLLAPAVTNVGTDSDAICDFRVAEAPRQ